MIRTILIILSIASFSLARPPYFNALSGQFPSNKLTWKCATCHGANGGLGLNQFGRDYHLVFVSPNPAKTPGIQNWNTKQKYDFLLNKIDSNKNGISNYQDVLNGTHPGQ